MASTASNGEIQPFHRLGREPFRETLLSRLVTLYNEATNWYTRQQILSAFVGDYSKTELLNFMPSLTKWRIDEARKHAFLTSPGQIIDPPVLQRCRLDPVKMDHFLDFSQARRFSKIWPTERRPLNCQMVRQ